MLRSLCLHAFAFRYGREVTGFIFISRNTTVNMRGRVIKEPKIQAELK